MKRLRKLFLVFTTMVVLLAALLFIMHPYLSITAPVQAQVAVVEGWMPAARMQAVQQEIDRRGYEHIYTTGTVRPFNYYLKNGESIELVGSEAWAGEVKINVSGIGNAGFILLADADTVVVKPVNGAPTTYHTRIENTAQRLVLLSVNGGKPPDTADNIYVKRFTIGGVNVHRSSKSVTFIRTDGRQEPGWPTHAHAAAALLVKHGIPASMITIAPAPPRDDSRTLANAVGFASMARMAGIDRFDVISLGVHARRSRKMYRNAMGDDATVGVISIPDPEVAPGTWWRHRAGRYRMLKEVAGMPVSSFFEAGE